MTPALPRLVVGDGRGQVFEVPELAWAGVGHLEPVVPEVETTIPLPFGSDLFELPGRAPVGFDPASGKFVTLADYRGLPVRAVAAFLAPAHLHHYRSAWSTEPGAPRLPLYCYAAVGWRAGKFYAAATRIDDDRRQDLELVDLELVGRRGDELVRSMPSNRLVRHLVSNCVLRYGCPAARNFTLGRFECPIPTTPGCNAACVGCISEQPAEAGIDSPHERIAFSPSVDEIVEVALGHLERVPHQAVVSFGQGCEGEPLLAGELLEEAIRAIRRRTDRGVINVNTNGSRPDVVERLCRAGLDSIRVSLNSARKPHYEAYYRPRTYRFEQVVESLAVVRAHGRWASINYLVFPGLTDHPAELEALGQLIERVELDMIQTRNLNIDPEWYVEELGLAGLADHLGMRGWLDRVRSRWPRVKLGYFNPPRAACHAAP